VDTELVGAVRPGDRVLVHAGVALTRLGEPAGGGA
jgi:hydrogenase maturation factor